MSKQLIKMIFFLILLFAVAYFINNHVARLVIVSGESMYPTFLDKDILLVNQMNYCPSKGDVVLINISERSMRGEYIVKRIIAVEGDTVTMNYEDNSVSVNGVKLSEPYLNFNPSDPMIALDEISNSVYKVPPGTVFVMGDNRNHSLDSRSDLLGMIKESDIMGKVFLHFSILQYFS